jgi:hypothetical protein
MTLTGNLPYSGREDEADCLMALILEMSHNTGKVNEKLKNLDSSCTFHINVNYILNR